MADAIALVMFIVLSVAGLWCYRLVQNTRSNLGASYWSEHRQNQLVFERLEQDHDTAIDQLIKNIQVNAKTLEVFLSLGELLRNKGEHSRAIKIHLHLLEQTNLTEKEFCDIRFELASDYIESGLLDRAESILLSLIEGRQQHEGLAQKARQKLLLVYQDAREWHKAISIVESLHGARCSDVQSEKWKILKAQFFCELAEQSRMSNDSDNAEKWLSAAIDINSNCVRASLLLAEQKVIENNFSAAIALLNKVPSQNAKFVSEILLPLSQCYKQMDRMADLIDVLRCYLVRYPDPRALEHFSDIVYQHGGSGLWLSSLSEVLEAFQDLEGVRELVVTVLSMREKNSSLTAQFHVSIQKLLSVENSVYECGCCGFTGNYMHWQCPGCKRWESICLVSR